MPKGQHTDISGEAAIVFECTGTAGTGDKFSRQTVEFESCHAGVSQRRQFIPHRSGDERGAADPGDLFRSMDYPGSGHDLLLQDSGKFSGNFFFAGTLASVEQAALFIVIDQRLGLLMENRKTVLGGFQRVIGALEEF